MECRNKLTHCKLPGGHLSAFQQQAVELPYTDAGLRKFRGHTARATGAAHLAHTQIELWCIQLFGCWGSDCFVYARRRCLSFMA